MRWAERAADENFVGHYRISSAFSSVLWNLPSRLQGLWADRQTGTEEIRAEPSDEIYFSRSLKESETIHQPPLIFSGEEWSNVKAYAREKRPHSSSSSHDQGHREFQQVLSFVLIKTVGEFPFSDDDRLCLSESNKAVDTVFTAGHLTRFVAADLRLSQLRLLPTGIKSSRIMLLFRQRSQSFFDFVECSFPRAKL